jgi:hypothetical protein
MKELNSLKISRPGEHSSGACPYTYMPVRL